MSEFDPNPSKDNQDTEHAPLEELLIKARSAEKLKHALAEFHEMLRTDDDDQTDKSHIELLKERLYTIREMETTLHLEAEDLNQPPTAIELDLESLADDDSEDLSSVSFASLLRDKVSYTPESLKFFDAADKQAASLAAHPLIAESLFNDALLEHRDMISMELRDAFLVDRYHDLANLLADLDLEVRLPTRVGFNRAHPARLTPTLAAAKASRETGWLIVNVKSPPEPDKIEIELWNLRPNSKEASILADNKDKFKSALGSAIETILGGNDYSSRMTLKHESRSLPSGRLNKPAVMAAFDKFTIQIKLKFAGQEDTSDPD